MAREIEFRAKMKEKPIGVNKIPWLYGGYFKHLKRQPYPVGDKITDDDYKHLMIVSEPADFGLARGIEAFEINPDTLGQYTGLKDVKGRRIYEGDIVSEKGHYVNSDKVVFEKIQWKDTYSCWLRGEYRRLTPKNIKQYQITVVGNIYDDAELLEDK